MTGAAAGTLVAGWAIERSGKVRSWPIVGSVLMVVGVGLLATLGPDSPVVLVGAWALTLGVGVGFVMQPSLLAAQNAAPVTDLGTATSAVLLTRMLGSTIGIPIFGGVLNAGLAGRAQDPSGFAHAVPFVFLAAVPMAALALIAALRLQDRPLRDDLALEALRAEASGLAPGPMETVPMASPEHSFAEADTVPPS